ncbi:DUF2971 domain-containing protein [Candidatus Hydrogenedentota bacterium]
MKSTSQERLDNLHKQLRTLAIEPHTVMPDGAEGGTIYHYTDAEGLESIIGTGMLWATNLPSLDDTLETKYPHRFCQEFLSSRLNECSSETRDLLRHAHNVLNRFSEYLCHYEYQFSISFSLASGLESQWRDYADKGKGFAIGFDTGRMLQKFLSDCTDPESTTEPYFTFRKMVYSPEKQKTILDSILAETLDAWPALCDLPLFQENTMEQHVACRLVLYLMLAATCFKDPSFTAEREYRVMAANGLEMKVAGTKLDVKSRTRSRDGKRIKYWELDVTDSTSGLMPISEVIIGAANDSTAAKKQLERVLQMKGYTGENFPNIVQAAYQPAV